MTTARTAVLLSGGGSNLQSMIDASRAGNVDLEVQVVVSNVEDAGGLQRARQAGIPAIFIDNGDYSDRESFDNAMVDALAPFKPDIVILAGFMRILTPAFVGTYAGRLLNIHPSLLPAYPGLRTHQRVLDNGDAWHGCTVHFVTEALDAGPAIIQGRVPVIADESAEKLAARVLHVEHRIYPIAANLLAQGRVVLANDVVTLDGEPMLRPIEFNDDTER